MVCTTDAKRWSERNEENIKPAHRKMLTVIIPLYGGLYNFYFPFVLFYIVFRNICTLKILP